MTDILIDRPGVAALIDAGDRVVHLELRTKMNILTEEVLEVIRQTLALRDRFDAVVVMGAGERAFSAGANLALFKARVAEGDFAAIEAFVAVGQKAFRALRQAPLPFVAAGFGLALGGGCELLMSCDAAVVHADLNAGMPETKVGLIPAWGGCTMLLGRLIDRGVSPLAAAEQAFDIIFDARVSGSAQQAADNGLLRPGGQIVQARDELFAAAKAKALSMVASYRPQPPMVLQVGGAGTRDHLLQRLEARPDLSAYDRVMAAALANILSGGGGEAGERSEDAMYALEAEALVALTRNAETVERINHMLATGKPLKN